MRLRTHYFTTYDAHWNTIIDVLTSHTLILLAPSDTIVQFLSKRIHEHITVEDVSTILHDFTEILDSIIGKSSFYIPERLQTYLLGIAYTQDIPTGIFEEILHLSQHIIVATLSRAVHHPIAEKFTADATGILSIQESDLLEIVPSLTSLDYWVEDSLPPLYLTFDEALSILPQHSTVIAAAQTHSVHLIIHSLTTDDVVHISSFARFNVTQTKAVTTFPVSLITLTQQSAVRVDELQLAELFHALFIVNTQQESKIVTTHMLSLEDVIALVDATQFSVSSVQQFHGIQVVQEELGSNLPHILRQVAPVELFHYCTPLLFILCSDPSATVTAPSPAVVSPLIEVQLETHIHALLSVYTGTTVTTSPITVFYQRGSFYLILPLIFQQQWHTLVDYPQVNLYYEDLGISIKGDAQIISHDFDEWRQFFPMWQFYEQSLLPLQHADFYWKRVVVRIIPHKIVLAGSNQ